MPGFFLGSTRHRPSPPVEIDRFDYSIGQFDLITPMGAETINVTGPAEVTVYWDGATQGSAYDDDRVAGLDEVVTQMTELELTGQSLTMGVVVVTVNPYIPSLGWIEEDVDLTTGVLDLDPFAPSGTTAQSGFNLYFQIDLPDLGLTFYTQDPKIITATITHKPPGPIDWYEGLVDIQLYDAFGRPVPGFFLGSTRHRPSPPVEIDVFRNAVAELELVLPDTPGILTGDSALPPTDGVYRTAADVHAEFIGPDLQIVLQDIRHRPFADPQPLITIVGADEEEQFMSSLTATAVITSMQYGLDGVEVPVYLEGPVTTIAFGKAGNTTGTFDTEIVAMDLSGEIGIPGGPAFQVVINTSPGLPSTGQTTITDLGSGQFNVDSFFDVFTEISIDGAPSILATAPSRVELAPKPGILSDLPELPPDGAYRTAADVHAEFQGPDLHVILQDVSHRAIVTSPVARWGVDGNEHELFDSTLTATAIVTSDSLGLFEAVVPLTLNGQVETVVFGKAANATGTFQTEILWMSLSGQIPGGPLIVIQESPNLPSAGRTSLNDLGNGQFEIDSFFDVFTELSVDGGVSFVAANASTRVELAPDPLLVTLHGTTKVAVYFDGDVEGSADDSDGDGLDEVVTEMFELDMTGFHPAVGEIRVRLHPTIPSRGEIVEDSNDTPGVLDVWPFGLAGSTATSNFALYLQVEMNGQTYFTEQPKFMSTVITNKPPVAGEVYEGLNVVPLISEFGFETPYRLGAARLEPAAPSEVLGRHIFYNNSSFDGNDPLPNKNDDNAIAPDKTALLPGETATFANYTSYVQGINGIMVDIRALPAHVIELGLDPSNFEFRVGNNNDPSSWTVVQDPGLQITVRPGDGVEGSDRVTLTWPDYVARKEWLQVTMLATEDTALKSSDVFYHGNAVGDTGQTVDEGVTAHDVLGTRNNPHPFFDPAELDTVYDFDRNRRVNVIDTLIARNNQTWSGNALRMLDLSTDPTAPSPIFEADLADLGTQTGRTAVLDRVFEEPGGLEDLAAAKLQWIHQFESTEEGSSSRKNQPARAVDELMAIFGF